MSSADPQGITTALGPQQVSGSPAVLGPAPRPRPVGLVRDTVGRDGPIDGGDCNCSVYLDTCLGRSRKTPTRTQIPLLPSSRRGSPRLRSPGGARKAHSLNNWPLTGQRQEVGGRALPPGTRGHSSRRRKRGRAHAPF